jgi:hypothetical protein
MVRFDRVKILKALLRDFLGLQSPTKRFQCLLGSLQEFSKISFAGPHILDGDPFPRGNRILFASLMQQRDCRMDAGGTSLLVLAVLPPPPPGGGGHTLAVVVWWQTLVANPPLFPNTRHNSETSKRAPVVHLRCGEYRCVR